MTEAAPLLQLCPNDYPPFLDICAVNESAAASIGRRMHTVFLSPARGDPMPGAVYLSDAIRQRTGASARALASALAELLHGHPALTICHRYRAYRVFTASRWRSSNALAIAHEFGFFGRYRRRLRHRLAPPRMRFAGVSPALVEELAETVHEPLLMPNGIDLARAAARRLGRPEALAALSIGAQGLNVGVIGRLHPKKQPQLALAAFAALCGDLAGSRLIFIGDGELRGELQNAARGLPVQFAGFVADAARLIKALDVLLISSGDAEAFSMVALEAMAAGVPVVAGPVRGPRFVLGEAGYYYQRFAPGEIAATVRQALTERHWVTSRVDRGVERAEREFSVTATARRLQTLLQ